MSGTDKTRVIMNKWSTARCDACRALIPAGEYVAYTPSMPRGRAIMHIDCVGAPPAVIAARHAIAKANEADEAAKRSRAAEDLAKAEEDVTVAIREILTWVFPRMMSTRERRAALRTRLDTLDRSDDAVVYRAGRVLRNADANVIPIRRCTAN